MKLFSASMVAIVFASYHYPASFFQVILGV